MIDFLFLCKQSFSFYCRHYESNYLFLFGFDFDAIISNVEIFSKLISK